MGDYDSVVDDLIPGQQAAASAGVVSQISNSPDDAQRAIDLAQQSGVPADVIHNNLDSFERMYKGQMASGIVSQNPHLQDFATSHPLAPTVANDDWGNLDAATKSVAQLGTESAFSKGVKALWDYNVDFAKHFYEGIGGFERSSVSKHFLETPAGQNLIQNHRLLASMFSAATDYSPAGVLASGVEDALRGMSGLIHGTLATAGDIYDKTTGTSQGQDLASKAEEMVNDPGLQASLAGLPEVGPFASAAAEALGARLATAARRAKPYIDARREPPVGLDPLIDHAKGQEAAVDIDNLMDALTVSQKSSLRERNPQMYADLLRGVNKGEIGIPSEIVRKLYGDTTPMPDDGLLGWVPGIEDQLIGAEPVGADIHVPVADWLAHVEPDLAKQIREDIRVRQNGLTLREAQELPPVELEGMRRAEQEEAPPEARAAAVEEAGGHVATDPNAELDRMVADLDRMLGQNQREEPVATERPPVQVYDANQLDRIGLERGITYPNEVTGGVEPDRLGTAERLSEGGRTVHVRAATGERFITAYDGHLVDDTHPAAQAFPDAYHHEESPITEVESHTADGWRDLYGQSGELGGWSTARRVSRERGIIAHVFDNDGNYDTTYHTGRDVSENRLYASRAPQPPSHELNARIINAINATRRIAGLSREAPYKGKVTLRENDISRFRNLTIGTYDLVGEDGEILGQIHFSTRGSDEINIGGINLNGYGYGERDAYNLLGHSTVRSILRQLKELFPDRTQISGYRVGGARQANRRAAEARMRFELSEHAAEFLHQMVRTPETGVEGETWYDLGGGVGATLKHPADQALIDEVDGVIKKLAPNLLRAIAVGSMKRFDEEGFATHRMGGTYNWFTDRLPILIWATDGGAKGEPLTVIRHEIIHHLRNMGFLTKKEWNVLSTAALRENWLDKHRIPQRYAGESLEVMIEESIAEEFASRKGYQEPWDKAKLDRDSPIDQIFFKLNQLYHGVREALSRAFGGEPDFNKIFDRIETGEVGRREGVTPIDPATYKPTAADFQRKGNLMLSRAAGTRASKEPELPGMTRLEDRPLFEPGAFARHGMTKRTQGKMEEFMLAQDARDNAFAAKQNEKAIAQRQTAEWKAQEKEIRAQVRPQIENRPDIQADKFLRDGTLYGEKVKGRPRLNSEVLTPEQRAALPKDYLAKGGLHPDDAAGLFGYHSGDDLITDLSILHHDREAMGMKPQRYLNHMVEQEVARRMKVAHGDLEQNILDEVQDHVIEQTAFDQIHQEILRLGTEAGMEMSLSKEDLAKMAKRGFEKVSKNFKTEDFLRLALKSNELSERALLEGKPKEAFQQKQLQLLNLMYAREAKKFERVQKRFNRLTAKYSSREVTGVDTEYVNQIHQLMKRFGLAVNRSTADLMNEMDHLGQETDLRKFIDEKNGAYGVLDVDDRFYDPTFNTQIKAMNTEEFTALTNALATLDKAGRDTKKWIKEGEVEDLAAVAGLGRDELKAYAEGKVKQVPATPTVGSKVTHLYRLIMTQAILNMETLGNRIDRGDIRGFFNQYFIRPLSSSANREYSLGRDYGAKIRGLGKIKDQYKQVRSPLIDPITRTEENPAGLPLTNFTRENIAVMISNAGNQYNWNVLAKGFGADPATLWNWLIQNTSKEEWARAEKLGGVFNDAFEEAGKVYRNVNGVAPAKIELQPFSVMFPNGDRFTSEGWYHPIIYDIDRTNKMREVNGQDVLDEGKAFWPSVANGYTKRRTGNVDVLDLTYNMLNYKLSQIIHDIAFRSEIIEAAKLANHPALKTSLRQYLGPEYKTMLDDFIMDAARGANARDRSMQGLARLSNFFRTNAIGTYIGFNPGTILKHGPSAWVNSMYEVGAKNFFSAFKDISLSRFDQSVRMLFEADPKISSQLHEFIDANSEEISRRGHNWRETLGGQIDLLDTGAGSTFNTVRNEVGKWGSRGVAISDMISARPTWLAAFLKEYEETGDFGNAIFAGDRAVRRAHGSTAVTNLPKAARTSGALAPWLTSLYGFFGTMMQRRVELAWKLNDAYKLGREGEIIKAMKTVPGITALAFTSLIWPTLVHSWVNSIGSDDHRTAMQRVWEEGWYGFTSSFLFLRDFGTVGQGEEPSVGLASSVMRDIAEGAGVLAHPEKSFDRMHAARSVQKLLTAIGIFTGVSPAQAGRVARYGIGTTQGTEPGRQPAVGLMRGTEKRRVQR